MYSLQKNQDRTACGPVFFFETRTVGAAKSWLEARLARYGSVLGFAFLGDLEPMSVTPRRYS